MCLPDDLKKHTNRKAKASGDGSLDAIPAVSFALVAILLSFQAGRATVQKFPAMGSNPTFILPVETKTEATPETSSSWSWNLDEAEADHPNTNTNAEGESSNEEPVRQQLLLDLFDVPVNLLRSEDALEERFEEVAEIFGVDLRAYSCHEPEDEDEEEETTRLPESIGCLGLSNDWNHISMVAWPAHQKVSIDFLASDEILEDGDTTFLEDISGLFYPGEPNHFALEHSGVVFEKAMKANSVTPSTWRLRNRAPDDVVDLGMILEIPGELRYPVVSLRTEFQQVDVVDIYQEKDLVDIVDAMQKDPAYFEANPERFRPDREFFLDGVIQSTRYGNAAYHEALVQPAMFAHHHPKRVAIIGGGECATLREVLKHNTVERAVMVEIDPGVIEASKHALPEWNDCSNLQGSSRYCMDDPRAEIYNEDAFRWFIDRYGGADKDVPEEELFDVIIVDALDPQNVVDFAKALYGDNSFLGSLYNSLSEKGILLTQVGNAPTMDAPSEQLSMDKNRIVYVNTLADIGFRMIFDYQENHAGFEEPWYFYAAFKDLDSASNWRASEAHFSLEMQKRGVRTVDGTSPFEYFDGPTMVSYQRPTKSSATLFCRRTPKPDSCEYAHGFEPDLPNFSAEHFEVRSSGAGDVAGRGLFATTDIPLDSYIMLEEAVYPVVVEFETVSLVDQMGYHEIADESDYPSIERFTDGYGYSTDSFGDSTRIYVDSGMLTFANHGCSGDVNVGEYPHVNDLTVSPDVIPEEFMKFRNEGRDYVFNPAHLRDSTYAVEIQNHRKEIKKGDEILENYFEMFDGKEDWKEQVEMLRFWCSGGVGAIERHQNEKRNACEESASTEKSCPPNANQTTNRVTIKPS